MVKKGSKIEDSSSTAGVTEGDEFLTKNQESNEIATRDNFGRHGSRTPVLAHQLSYWGRGSNLGQFCTVMPLHLFTSHRVQDKVWRGTILLNGRSRKLKWRRVYSKYGID